MNDSEKLRKLLVKGLKIMAAAQCLSYRMCAYAATSGSSSGGSLESTSLVQGILNLATDAGKVALVVEAVVLGALEVIEGLKYQFGEDDEKPKHVKAAKRNLAVGALIMASSGLITVILSYFQA